MNTKTILSQVEKLHAAAARTKPKIARAAGLRWLVVWNGSGFTCTPLSPSNLSPVDYNTRSQVEACKWLRESHSPEEMKAREWLRSIR
jgi:hypothetical protein